METMVYLSEAEYLELKGKLDELLEFKNMIMETFQEIAQQVNDNPMLSMMFGGNLSLGNSNH